MEIKYYTVATTRCMGVIRDETLVLGNDPLDPNRECFAGFESKSDAERFILNEALRITEEYPDSVKNATIAKQDDGSFLLTYDNKCGWGETARWRESRTRYYIHEYVFRLVRPGYVLNVRLK